MSIGKRFWDVARANVTGFASAFTRDEDARERARIDREVDDEVAREVQDTVGAKAGRRARKFADKAEEAWEQAYEAAQKRGAQGGGGGTPSQREVEGWYRTLEVPIDSDLDTVRKSYRRLVAKYHPDRFTDEPAKVEAATEVTRKITIAYNGIKAIHEKP
ncbi:DnaJ domain-containing protein [Nannocystaceae bacterium ST9]